jgi:hypothetical protein
MYQTTTPVSGKFRDCIRAVANLTSDDELLRIAELPEVPVPLENCRQLDPQTRIVMVCRLDVSPAETPRWRRASPTRILPWPQGEPMVLDMCRGARTSRRRELAPCGASRGPPGITRRLQFTAVHRHPGRTPGARPPSAAAPRPSARPVRHRRTPTQGAQAPRDPGQFALSVG